VFVRAGDSSVSVVTVLPVGRKKNRASIPIDAGSFSSLQNSDRLWGPPAHLYSGY